MSYFPNSGKQAVCGILIACMLVSFSGCNTAQPTSSTALANTAIAVETQTPQLGVLEVRTEFIGSLQPDELVNVFPNVSGTVLATYAQVGDIVRKGDLLFEIDPVDIQMQYDAAAAQVQAKRVEAEQRLGSGYDANLIALKSQMDAAQTQLNNARTVLKNYNDSGYDALRMAEKKRDKYQADLKAVGKEIEALDSMSDEEIKSKYGHSATRESVTKRLKALELQLETDYSLANAHVNELEDDDDPTLRTYRTAYKNAQIAYEAARDAYNVAAGVSREDTGLTVEAGLRAAEISLEAQAKQLAYTKVYAPIDGVIEAKFVSAQDIASMQSPAYTVSNKNTLMVVCYVSADTAAQLQPGNLVEVESGSQTNQAIVSEVSGMADAATGLFKIKASLQGDTQNLLTGVNVKVIAVTQRAQDAVMVSEDLVYYDNGQSYLYCVQDGLAKKVPVELGISNSEMVQIVSGLDLDAQIISTWSARLRDGALVALKATDQNAVQTSAKPDPSAQEDTHS